MTHRELWLALICLANGIFIGGDIVLGGWHYAVMQFAVLVVCVAVFLTVTNRQQS